MLPNLTNVQQKIQNAFDAFNQLTVLVVGDVMIDAYMWGKVERISPEAPVPVISVTKRENRLGGAANVGLNIKALGASPILCAAIGDDESGQTFLNLLQQNSLPDVGILMSKHRQTTIKTRIISDNQHLLRVDEETDKPLNAEIEAAFMAHITQLFSTTKIDAVIFEDYDKGNITPAIIAHVVNLARKHQIITLVDPKKRNFMAYQHVTLFKPNFKEICEGLKIDLPKGDFEALHQAALKLKGILSANHIMVTLSELGVYITEPNGYHRVPAQVRDIADVSGAGDTVISVTACAMAAGLAPTEAAGLANLAGGLVCEKVGVVPIDKDMLHAEAVRFFAEQ